MVKICNHDFLNPSLTQADSNPESIDAIASTTGDYAPNFFLQLVGERGRQNTDNLSGLQNGVQVMIFVAFIIVALVVIYAILYQVVLSKIDYD